MNDTIATASLPTNHASYLGGSDIGAAMGLSPYKTPLSVWAEKTGRAPPFSNARTQSGQRFERVILANYAEERGAELSYPGTIRHANGITGTTPDAIADGRRNVQVKMVGYHESRRWGEVGLAEDGIPSEVLAQIHWEWWHIREVLGVSDDVIHVATQFGTEPRVYEIIVDPSFAENMVEAGLKFWRDHVVTDRMPMVTENDGSLLRHMYKRAGQAMEPMPADVHELVSMYHADQQTESAAKKRKEALGAQLMERIRDGLGFLGATCKVSWRQERGRIDWESIARELGATDEMADGRRGEDIRKIDVRMLKAKG